MSYRNYLTVYMGSPEARAICERLQGVVSWDDMHEACVSADEATKLMAIATAGAPCHDGSPCTGAIHTIDMATGKAIASTTFGFGEG